VKQEYPAMEILFTFAPFIVLALVFLAAVFVIPLWVTTATEAESNPNHLYSIFMQESGSRGHKVFSASGCFLPFMLITKEKFEVEGIVAIILISAVCFFCHKTVYSGYNVLNIKLKKILSFFVVLMLVLSFMTRFNILSGAIYAFIFPLLGFYWGATAVHSRAKLIHAERS